jgi:hypothetical protein
MGTELPGGVVDFAGGEVCNAAVVDEGGAGDRVLRIEVAGAVAVNGEQPIGPRLAGDP